MMPLLESKHLEVRRAALVTLNSIAFHRSNFVTGMLYPGDSKLVTHLFKEMRIKPELIYKKNLGPYIQIVDDGLPLRKAAFSCMLTLIEVSSP